MNYETLKCIDYHTFIVLTILVQMHSIIFCKLFDIVHSTKFKPCTQLKLLNC